MTDLAASLPGFFEPGDPTRELLVATLQAAVPMWIDQYQNWDTYSRQCRATHCADEVAAHGDILVFKQKTAEGRKGTVNAFNRLAEGIAILAYNPGGVTFAGHHWCVGSNHMGVEQARTGPCEAELQREKASA